MVEQQTKEVASPDWRRQIEDSRRNVSLGGKKIGLIEIYD